MKIARGDLRGAGETGEGPGAQSREDGAIADESGVAGGGGTHDDPGDTVGVAHGRVDAQDCAEREAHQKSPVDLEGIEQGDNVVGGVLDDDVYHAAEIAGAHPSLRETVIAFAEADMSITRCARSSHLHANTVVYRLGRWRELTGWDPRTFFGLTRSFAAGAFADARTVSSAR